MYLKYIEVDTIDYIVLQEEEISDIDMIYCLMCPSTGVHYLAQLSSPVKKKYSTLIV